MPLKGSEERNSEQGDFLKIPLYSPRGKGSFWETTILFDRRVTKWDVNRLKFNPPVSPFSKGDFVRKDPPSPRGILRRR